jgi:peptidoglycan/LPS O-acetylase OafA/YrhL
LDGLPGVAALYVVLHHAWLQAWPIDRPPTGATAFWTGWLLWGHFAVTLFIVISGYCLALPLVRHPERAFSARDFLRRRARRILPPYYFGLAFTLLLIVTCVGEKTGTNWDTVLPLTITKLLSGVLLVPDIYATVNHAYWSIGVECKIYLLFPLLVWAWRRVGVARATAIFTLAAYVLASLAHGTARASMSPHYLAMFCWGAAAAWVTNTPARGWLWIRDTRAWYAAVCTSLLALTALCLRWGTCAVTHVRTRHLRRHDCDGDARDRGAYEGESAASRPRRAGAHRGRGVLV